MTTATPRSAPGGSEAARLIGALGLVLLGAGGALRALDALPQWLGGERRGVTRFPSIEGAERALGERLFMPAYFPDTLRWPPASIRVFDGPPAWAALEFASRDGGTPGLVMYQARGTGAPAAVAVMPPARVLHEVDLPMEVGTATLVRVELPDGAIGNDLVWHRGDETLALRYLGPADELVTIARSLRRRRP